MKSCLIKFCVTIVWFTVFNNIAFSQGKFEFSVGYGVPEALNIKTKYGTNIQIGLCQVISPGFIDWPLEAEIYYHFAGKSKFTEQKTWYLIAGMGDLWRMNDVKFFYPKLGRSFNFSKIAGLTIDTGVYFINPSSWHLEPSVNFCLFLRL